MLSTSGEQSCGFGSRGSTPDLRYMLILCAHHISPLHSWGSLRLGTNSHKCQWSHHYTHASATASVSIKPVTMNEILHQPASQKQVTIRYAMFHHRCFTITTIRTLFQAGIKRPLMAWGNVSWNTDKQKMHASTRKLSSIEDRGPTDHITKRGPNHNLDPWPSIPRELSSWPIRMQ